MAVYEKWQEERYSIGCETWEARCPNCHELVESADPISSNYRFCPYCGFDMKSDFQRVADRRQFTECLMKLKEAMRLLKAAVEDLNFVSKCQNCKYRQTGFENECVGCRGNKYEWRYADKALELIGKDGDTDGRENLLNDIPSDEMQR